ncbi:MAG: hypothetical protein ACLTSZ_19100 [Lachnospiraceae bacterium]
MIRNRKYLGRRVLAVLLAASVVCSSVLPAAAEELVSPDVAEESGMLIDAAEDDTSSGADDAIMDEDVPENGIADTEETESGWDEADGLILQMEEVEDPELVEEALMAAASHMITKAEELPTNIESGETYVLAADITPGGKSADRNTCRYAGRTGAYDYADGRCSCERSVRNDPESGCGRNGDSD